MSSQLSLSPTELLGFAGFVAAEVSEGGYPFVEYDDEERWHQRIYRDQRVDVWLISWMPSQTTQLHDHGGSSGAFWTVSGILNEATLWRGSGLGGTLVEREHKAGSGVSFGAHYVHDVRNLSDSPAVSVHVYSPPLAQMNYYDLSDRGRLEKIASIQTEDPEPVLAPDTATAA